MTFRKFYNADAGEAVASEMVATSTAEALARFGKKSGSLCFLSMVYPKN